MPHPLVVRALIIGAVTGVVAVCAYAAGMFGNEAPPNCNGVGEREEEEKLRDRGPRFASFFHRNEPPNATRDECRARTTGPSTGSSAADSEQSRRRSPQVSPLARSTPQLTSPTATNSTRPFDEESLQTEYSFLLAMEQKNEERRRELDEENVAIERMQQELQRKRREYEEDLAMFEEELGQSTSILLNQRIGENALGLPGVIPPQLPNSNSAGRHLPDINREVLWDESEEADHAIEEPASTNLPAVLPNLTVPMFPSTLSTADDTSVVDVPSVSGAYADEEDAISTISTVETVTTTSEADQGLVKRSSSRIPPVDAMLDSTGVSRNDPFLVPHAPDADTEDSWSEISSHP